MDFLSTATYRMNSITNEFKSAVHWARARERARKMVSEAWTAFIFILVIEKRTKLRNFHERSFVLFLITKIKMKSVSDNVGSQITGAVRASSM